MTITTDITTAPRLTEDMEALGWVYVGRDPDTIRYWSEDSEAIDETNWKVLEDTLAEFPEAADPDADGDWCYIPWGWGSPFRDYHPGRGVVLVRADTEAAEAVDEIRAALEGYPLLDEDAYYEREFEAWLAYWASDAWRDVASDAAWDFLADRDVDPAEDWEALDTLTDAVLACEDLGAAAQQAMGYYNGFTGEYDREGAVAAVVGALEALEAYLGAFTRLAQDVARFQPVLPLAWAA